MQMQYKVLGLTGAQMKVLEAVYSTDTQGLAGQNHIFKETELGLLLVLTAR
jgi:hypothetical protein